MADISEHSDTRDGQAVKSNPSAALTTITVSSSSNSSSSSSSSSSSRHSLLQVVALLTLAVQNAALLLVTRHARTRQNVAQFSTASAVVCSELVKLTLCTCLSIYTAIGKQSGCSCCCCWCCCSSMGTSSSTSIAGDAVDCLRMAVPALLYVAQNNMFYVAISNLDAVTCQVTDQLKLLSTALFSQLLLRRSIDRVQLASLFVLFVGAAVIQMQTAVQLQAPRSGGDTERQNRVLGLTAAISACCLSGLAGVYLEWILKCTNKSLWWRNAQLAGLGVCFGSVAAFAKDGLLPGAAAGGFFGGYDAWVVAVILLQSLGGLIVAVVLKYADSILKTIATSVAMAIVCVVSSQLADLQPNPAFLCGLGLVMAGTVVYGSSTAAAVPGVNGSWCGCSAEAQQQPESRGHKKSASLKSTTSTSS